MKYKVGDRVRIKSLDWYNENRNKINEVKCGVSVFIPAMTTHCGYIRTISKVFEIQKVYNILEDNGLCTWTDEMIEGLVEEETKPCTNINDMNNDAMIVPTSAIVEMVKELGVSCPNGYIFKDENGNVINATKIILEKKKKEYPKTYEECEKVLGLEDSIIEGCLGYEYKLLNAFQKLLMCRDAYWKIAGEEMGLGKPWEPDYTEESYEQGSPIKYVIYYTGTYITKGQKCTPSYILSFPTEEMRDAFKENFDPDIEKCKELL